ncbi:MAG: aspartate kinase, partial [Acidiferrobacterales bacterium]
MALIVQKYGGTSVADTEHINAVADRVARMRAVGDIMVVVVSAMSGETDRLLKLATEVDDNPLAREVDVLLATGEQEAAALLSMALHQRGCDARSYMGHQVHILTDNIHGKARIRGIDGDRVRKDLDRGRVVVVAGFQGVDEEGNITTLGRGGSDTTAVAMAAALKADECQIYTDVDGIYTADPRIVPEARRLDRVTVEEMLELASLGAKVLQTRSVQFAGKYKVPLRVLSSFEEGPGTLISYEENEMEEAVISGIAFTRDEAKLTVLGVPDRPGVAYKLFDDIAAAGIEVDMIVQNVAANGLTDVTFTVHRGDYAKAMNILKKAAEELSAEKVEGDDKIVKISVVGVGMRSHAGVAS